MDKTENTFIGAFALVSVTLLVLAALGIAFAQLRRLDIESRKVEPAPSPIGSQTVINNVNVKQYCAFGCRASDTESAPAQNNQQ